MSLRLPFFLKIVISLFFLLLIQFSYLIQLSKEHADEKEIYAHGVIDRIINESLAVIIIPVKNEQIFSPIHELPKGSGEGLWLNLIVTNGNYTILSIDDEKTHNQSKENKRMKQQIRKK